MYLFIYSFNICHITIFLNVLFIYLYFILFWHGHSTILLSFKLTHFSVNSSLIYGTLQFLLIITGFWKVCLQTPSVLSSCGWLNLIESPTGVMGGIIQLASPDLSLWILFSSDHLHSPPHFLNFTSFIIDFILVLFLAGLFYRSHDWQISWL